jgi:hypothetical protein
MMNLTGFWSGSLERSLNEIRRIRFSRNSGLRHIHDGETLVGEITPGMAEAVCASRAEKILIPLTQEKVKLATAHPEPLPQPVEKIVEMIGKRINPA